MTFETTQRHYVYIAYVDGVPKYVGRGTGKRYLHCCSGKSSCYWLNRDVFIGKTITTEFVHDDLSWAEAKKLEAQTISELGIQNLYNISAPSLNQGSRTLIELRDTRANWLISLWRQGDMRLCDLDAAMPSLKSPPRYIAVHPHHRKDYDSHWHYCVSWMRFFDDEMASQWIWQLEKWTYPESEVFKNSHVKAINSAARQCISRWEALELGENMKWYSYLISLLSRSCVT